MTAERKLALHSRILLILRQLAKIPHPIPKIKSPISDNYHSVLQHPIHKVPSSHINSWSVRKNMSFEVKAISIAGHKSRWWPGGTTQPFCYSESTSLRVFADKTCAIFHSRLHWKAFSKPPPKATYSQEVFNPTMWSYQWTHKINLWASAFLLLQH